MAFRRPKKKDAGAKNAGAAAEKKGGASGNLAVMFVMMLVVFLAGSAMVIGYFKFLDPAGKEAQAEEKQEPQALSTMEMGGLIINLADGGGNHFLKLTITIEYSTENKKAEEELQAKKHIITETMLLTLRSKTVDEVRPPEAVDRLKGELIQAVNKRLGEDLIKKIYFTEYIVQ